MQTLTIQGRFNGPPTSGHGGFVAGMLASSVDAAAVQVTLRSPPPLDHPFRVRREGSRALLEHDGALIAEAEPASLDVEVPDRVSFEDAEVASHSYPGFAYHVYPTCFVCGPERAAGDGLRVFVGAVPGRRVAAGPWVPDESVPTTGDEVDEAVMWSVLDCPGFWGVTAVEEIAEHVLLGRLTVRIERRARVGERCVVLGWPLGRDGRKIYAGAAVFGEDGVVLAVSSATWIVLKT